MQEFLSVISEKRKKLVLAFFNKTEKDIMWKDELEKLKKKHSERFEVHHILSQDEKWKGYKGRISEGILNEIKPEIEPQNKLWIGICGPNPFASEAKR